MTLDLGALIQEIGLGGGAIGCIWNISASLTNLSERPLIPNIFTFLGGIPRPWLAWALHDLASAGKRPVLIIDEAHLIPSAEVFEEIRLLTNFQLDQKNLIPIILMGQPSLRQRLRHSTYRPLIQRIGLYYNIEPLLTEETMAYIRHRLSVAGVTYDLFSEEALLSIHHLSRGIPRLVNTLCETALLIAFGKREKGVNEGIIKAVARDFKWLLEEESR